MLARGAAAEIVAGDENLGVAIGRFVEHEIGIFAAIVLVALFGEQALAEAGALDGLEVLFGDDHVGVDIDDLERRGDAFQHGELVHFRSRSLFHRGPGTRDIGLVFSQNRADGEVRKAHHGGAKMHAGTGG